MNDVGFIPTTRQVREAYEVAHEEVGVPCDIAGFDRWLNGIIQQAKAEALAEGDGYHTHEELYEYRMLYNAHADRTRPLIDVWLTGYRVGQEHLLRSPGWYERARRRLLEGQETKDE